MKTDITQDGLSDKGLGHEQNPAGRGTISGSSAHDDATPTTISPECAPLKMSNPSWASPPRYKTGPRPFCPDAVSALAP